MRPQVQQLVLVGDPRQLPPTCRLLHTANTHLIPTCHSCLQVQQLVLVGDPRQLPPTVKSRQAAGLGLQLPLFERLQVKGGGRGGGGGRAMEGWGCGHDCSPGPGPVTHSTT